MGSTAGSSSDASPSRACIPEGAERVYRYYNGHSDDYAIFPESEKAKYEGQGYGPTGGELAPVIGYAYPNRDADDDILIDGFERLLGTDPQIADTDCDRLCRAGRYVRRQQGGR